MALFSPEFSNHRITNLSGVVGVDVDVLMREVGGPEDARSGALVELDGDGKLGLADVGVGRGFVELSSAAAIATDGQIAE